MLQPKTVHFIQNTEEQKYIENSKERLKKWECTAVKEFKKRLLETSSAFANEYHAIEWDKVDVTR